MATTTGTSPKGLLNALALFIGTGLFGLATLFTLLILDVRHNQQRLITQLSSQGEPLAPITHLQPSVTAPRSSSEREEIERIGRQLTQIQATLEALPPPPADRADQLDALLNQLHQLDQKIDPLSSHLTQLSAAATIAKAQWQSKLETLSRAHVHQQAEMVALHETVDKMARQQQSEPGEKPLIQQITQKVAQKVIQEVTQEVGQQIKRLSDTISRSALSSSPPAEWREIRNQLEQIEKIVTTVEKRPLPPPSPSTAAIPAEQLDIIQKKLEQLTRAEKSNNLITPQVQSNTIKPYSYQAR
ncbi:MAG: hypothetical protein HN842_08960 [Gammaproteobacteria bacterium]|jgi:hypothetical protein|nr:hypothetical protein [Gammaproteobacteria bacterium]MBT7308336.1 hypothetical protein [Gammaproteobacteria bacterium]